MSSRASSHLRMNLGVIVPNSIFEAMLTGYIYTVDSQPSECEFSEHILMFVSQPTLPGLQGLGSTFVAYNKNSYLALTKALRIG